VQVGTYEGTAQLVDDQGGLIKRRVTVRLSDDLRSAPSYAKAAPYHGEIWVTEGDLMDPVRGKEHCQLLLPDGVPLQIFVNSFDLGGSRAQVVGESGVLPPLG
jgi:hypothetical protein